MAKISTLTRQVGAANELLSITIGNSDFPEIRRNGFLFVDKTAQIPRLLRYKKVFFARPRRFGKTTLASMLFELFMHGTEKFEGLAVYNTWPKKQCYPTIMISLYGLDQPSTFEAKLCAKLTIALKNAGLIDLYDRTKSITRLGTFFVETQFDLEARGSVWLIDEWDFPLSANLDNCPAFDANMQVLKKLFSNLRELCNLHFMLVTGITRFQPGGFLLPGQDIVNISMNPAYADLVGYTQAEVEANFAPYIERAAQLLGMSREAFLEQLKLHYGGFCFDANVSASLYCPWSINNFFQQVVNKPEDKPSFASFWMNSAGGSQALRSFLSARHVKLDLLEQALGSGLQVRAGNFNDPAKFEQLDLPVIMVQAGYLTLKKNVTPGCPSYNRAWYACGFPNLEVAAPFTAVAFAVAMAAYMGPSNFKQVVAELQRAVRALDMAAMVQALNALLVAVGSELEAPLTEGQYHIYLSLSLRAAHLGCAVPAPTDTSQGRSEIELASSGKLRVIVLKRLPAADASPKACLALAQEAQDQLLGRGDGRNDGQECHAVVLVLSEQAGQIVYWRRLFLDQAEQEPQLSEGWVEPWPLEESKPAASAGETAPLINPMMLKATFGFAHHLADRADHVVTLDPAMLARGMQSYAAKLYNQQGTFSPEQIKDYVERYIDKIQQVSSPEKAKVFDRAYLEQQLVALLSKEL